MNNIRLYQLFILAVLFYTHTANDVEHPVQIDARVEVGVD